MSDSSDRNQSQRSTRIPVALGTVVTVVIQLILLILLLLPLSGDVGSGTGGGSGGGSGESTGRGTGDGADANAAAGGDSLPGAATTEGEIESAQVAETTFSESARQPPERELRRPTPPEQFVLGALPDSAPEPETSETPVESASGGRGSGGSGGRGGGGGDASEFFGVKSKGRRFVYIVDQSGSMIGNRFQRACGELLEAIDALSSRQSFYVYFFTDSERPMFDDTAVPKLIRANAQNKRKIREWVETLSANGGNGAETQSILDGVSLKPDAIYFLSDGGFDPNTANQVREGNSEPPVPVNTIGFEDRSREELLQQIADDSGGKYRFVP